MSDVKTVVSEMQKLMEKSTEATRREFKNIRTGRASTALVESVIVNYYDTPTPLKSLANISTPDARTLAITPWDVGGVGEIERAIQKSDLGLNPMSDGKVIRIAIPALTEERRLDLTRVVRKVAEEGRISIRNARHEAIDKIKKLEKEKLATEDDVSRSQKDIQKQTDKFIGEVDAALEKKEEEIHEV